MARMPSVLLPVLAALAFVTQTPPAAAHPHVFVVARTEILFNAQGLVAGVRQSWTFDDMYSSFVTTGIRSDGKPATPEQLQPVAEQNVHDLAEYSYFTSLKAAGQKIELAAPQDASMSEDQNKIVTLRFTIPLKTPASASKVLALQVYDPTYFVAFDLAKDGVKLVSAPTGCSLSVTPPKPLADAEQQRLTEAFFSGLSPGTDFGIKLAARALVACP